MRSSARVGHERRWISSFLIVAKKLSAIETVAFGAHRLGDPRGAGLLAERERHELWEP